MDRRAMTATALFERGLEAHHGGDADGAIAAYRDALVADPALAPAHFNLGQLYRNLGRHQEAADCFSEATRLRPAAADAWLNLGVSLEQLGELPRALDAFRRADQIAPADGTAAFNMGNALKKQGDLRGAVQAYGRAVERHPDAPQVRLNLGNTLREAGQPARAVTELEAALALRPDWVEARWNLALAKLAAGRLDEGWELYDTRWELLGLPITRGFTWPLWRGEPANGKRFLVWREQGIGDDLLFAGCVPELVDRGARVTLAVDPRLVSLLGRAFPEVEVVADGAWGDEPFHYHTPLGSLPRYLRRDRQAFRAPWNLFLPERDRIRGWAERLRALGPGLRVGLCWRSGIRGPERERHYPSLRELAPLAALRGVTWVSLQYDDAETELRCFEAGLGVEVHRWDDLDQRNDFESVAALIWNLDLVLTAPTAVSSLAGGLGVETWQLEGGSDWTAFGEERSPWLPAIRLFRRDPSERSWRGVVERVHDALQERIATQPDRLAVPTDE
ncbi:MAG: tetratricopeptide repeat protein [Gemmatimonadales bacterium]